MRIIAKKSLRDFWEKHRDAKESLSSWYHIALSATWKSPSDVKRTFSTASIIGDNRVVFDIKGNSYRLIVKINYHYGIVYVRFIGTHGEYDRINAEEI